MGMVSAKRTIAHLDNDVLHGLAAGDAACDLVSELRRNGTRVYMSPTVVDELGRAGRSKRDRLIDAACRYCDGITRMQSAEILEFELKSLASAIPVDRAPHDKILRISTLDQLRSDGGVLRVLGPPFMPSRKDWISVLDRLRQAISTDKAVDRASFEAFFASIYSHCVQAVLGPAVESLRLPSSSPVPPGAVRPPSHAISLAIAVYAASAYRQTQRLARSGAGCLSDIRNVIEASYADLFLTRDVELAECALLALRVIEERKLRVQRLPAP